MENGNKPKALGKGLDKLFFNSSVLEENQINEIEMDNNNKILEIDINQIKPNQEQPRKAFEDEKLNELAQSVLNHGILQPILVEEEENGYKIIAGERRWRAARKANLKTIPCIIKHDDVHNNMLVALIENMQREDLNPIEEATAFEKIMNEYNYTQDAIAKSVGKSRPYIANALRLLKLDEDVKKHISEGSISGGHARAIVSINNAEKQKELAKEIISKGLSVRQAETLISESNKSNSKSKIAKSKAELELSNIEAELKAVLGTKVKILAGDKKGKIEIDYFTMEELERIIELLLSIK